mmetsp:Transcript_127588/g.303182  ORF Transcript_127588/g.303182 Transcript_127588/m.303182 type:complete len:148 (+) Transcript_127588:49-492(+)
MTATRLTPRGHALSGEVLGRAFGLAAVDEQRSFTGTGQAGQDAKPADVPEVPDVRQASGQRQSYNRDSVAFLLGRAPETSQPPTELLALQVSTPRGLFAQVSTTKACYGTSALEGADLLDGRYTRKRDRVTEYLEILNQQSHIVRKK